MKKERRKYHRGRRKKKTRKQMIGSVISTIVLLVALVVFCFSAFKLYEIFHGYHEGESEYEELEEIAIVNKGKGEEEDRFQVDFDALKEINQDVVGWIRFEEPAVISYPVVQGRDNAEYLYKTFKGYDNTVGSIFVNAYNNPDFNDQNTLIYGHYMYNGTMFNELEQYAKKEFWEQYPYFYIYRPDGTELKYQIYCAGVVKDTSESYIYQFADEAAFTDFVNITKAASNYDTGVEVGVDAQIVTLSTCTKDNNDDRFVVHAVKVSERGPEDESN